MTEGISGVEATKKLLAHFPDADFEIVSSGKSIEIKPSGAETFPISLYDQVDNTMIAAERWHTHYEDHEQAAWCALWLLTPFYRLVHEMKGGVLVATWIERYEATGWEGFEPVFFLNPEHEASWERVGEEMFARRYHQQAVLDSPMPYATFCPGAVLDAAGRPVGWRAGSWIEHDEKSQGVELFE